MRPRVKPALRRVLRDEQTLQYGVHPLRAVLVSGLTRPIRQWLECLDGTRDLDRVLGAAAAAGLDEHRARALIDQLSAQGALHDAAISPSVLRDLTLAERDRLRPDLDVLDLSSTSPDGGMELLARRRAARVRVYGAGRVGAQVVALLAAAGVGHIRVIDPGMVRPGHITPGGLSWAEVGMTREEGAAAVARRLTSGGRPPHPAPDDPTAPGDPDPSAPTDPGNPCDATTSSTASSTASSTTGFSTTGSSTTASGTATSSTALGPARPQRANAADPQRANATGPQRVNATDRQRASTAGRAASPALPQPVPPRRDAPASGRHRTTADDQPPGPRRAPQAAAPGTTPPVEPGAAAPSRPRPGPPPATAPGSGAGTGARTGAGAGGGRSGMPPGPGSRQGRPLPPPPNSRQPFRRGRSDMGQGTDMRYLGRPPSQRAAELAARQEALAPPRKRRRGRDIDGHDLVRPTVEVLAGGTYLGDQSDRPDLVVIAPVTPLDGVLANELTALGIPHLLAAAFEGHGMVGPLVLPGRTACLHCLDLARRDRDPTWPIVTAKVGGYPPGEIACDVVMAALVAAEATGHVLAHLDGKESAVTNSTIDVTPDRCWQRSSWQLHPQCRCMRNNPYSLTMDMSPHRD
ncbi:ThiF family adenylyltransferase [Nonomuraea sp. NPDC050783]|uniref:ThiF family adenylyltransferase n=1 Tax=Nonomuraea sp. NPDC050783 TaxID=3154634 RepID=UPI003467E262